MLFTFLRRLVFGCWTDHGNLIRGRDNHGYFHRCDRCGYRAAILPGQSMRLRRVCVESLDALAAGWRKSKVREWQERRRA